MGATEKMSLEITIFWPQFCAAVHTCHGYSETLPGEKGLFWAETSVFAALIVAESGRRYQKIPMSRYDTQQDLLELSDETIQIYRFGLRIGYHDRTSGM